MYRSGKQAMKIKLKWGLLATMFWVTPAAWAQTYVCVNKDGSKTYTDNNKSGCSKPKLATLSAYSSSQLSKRNLNSTAVSYSIADRFNQATNHKNVPFGSSDMQVSSHVQAVRDDKRKAVLLTELKNEVAALRKVQSKVQTFKSDNNPDETLAGLEEQVKEHQENISLITRELARIR